MFKDRAAGGLEARPEARSRWRRDRAAPLGRGPPRGLPDRRLRALPRPIAAANMTRRAPLEEAPHHRRHPPRPAPGLVPVAQHGPAGARPGAAGRAPLSPRRRRRAPDREPRRRAVREGRGRAPRSRHPRGRRALARRGVPRARSASTCCATTSPPRSARPSRRAPSFVRANVLAGVVATDQGVIEGQAARWLRYRRQLGVPIEIWADALVKHGTALHAPGIAAGRPRALRSARAPTASSSPGRAPARPRTPRSSARSARAACRVRSTSRAGVTHENVGGASPARRRRDRRIRIQGRRRRLESRRSAPRHQLS